MYDELVKKLRYCANAISCLHCPYWKGCGGSKEDLSQAADAIEELQKANCELLFRVGQAEALIDYYQTGKAPSNKPPKEET